MTSNTQLERENALIDWAAGQEFDDWRVVTLKYPFFSNEAVWKKVLVHTFRELEQSFMKGKTLTQNKAIGAGSNLLRIVVLGGNRNGNIKLHCHCFVDGVGDDKQFTSLLNRAWKNNMSKELRKLGIPYRDDAQLDSNDEYIYVERGSGERRNYLKYTLRYEGEQLGNGINKVVLEATKLN